MDKHMGKNIVNCDTVSDEHIERAIEKGERQHAHIAKGMWHTTDGKAVVTEDLDWQMYLRVFERAAKRLTTGGGAMVVPFKSVRGMAHKLSALGNDVRLLCVNALPLVERAEQGFHMKGHSFRKADGTIAGLAEGEPYTFIHAIPNPHITVMIRACMQIAEKLSDFHPGEWADVNEPKIRNAFVQAARFVKRVCNSRRFRTVVLNHERSERKNLKSCWAYAGSLFEKYSKLLVLRIDLYIHPDSHAWSESDRAEWCVSQYLRALRENRLIEPDVKGWIVKREGGFRRGIHFHLMVFLDGHKHQEGHVYSQQLGEAWTSRFSEGKGTFFNCWVLRKKYEHNALGVVRISDRVMLTGLLIALAYMTKEDCALETGRSRNLRRGIIESSDGPKPGAPRKTENDLSVLKSVFSDSPFA
ncbi:MULTISPECIES: inovirus-type Gp2 protein [Rhodanobacter]|jgi:hypothetical protein|uniref:Inovirus-type Gp2 protein n=2 Tax=Rhodanobacter TaxID=75309 RepID=A0ABW0JWQ1_9GAMM|nr:inovirus-type Gp2 protein [Rhodanobacter sp. Root627]KRA35164.1 hypothetical protein ASD68_01585 [Rhodanobacter sp. Root627]